MKQTPFDELIENWDNDVALYTENNVHAFYDIIYPGGDSKILFRDGELWNVKLDVQYKRAVDFIQRYYATNRESGAYLNIATDAIKEWYRIATPNKVLRFAANAVPKNMFINLAHKSFQR